MKCEHCENKCLEGFYCEGLFNDGCKMNEYYIYESGVGLLGRVIAASEQEALAIALNSWQTNSQLWCEQYDWELGHTV